MTIDIFRGCGVEISLKNPEDFLKVKETLTRIGIASRTEKKLYQSTHILHKQGRYVLIHFKELFILDGKPSNFSPEDLARRNTIVTLLQEWNLLTIHQPAESLLPLAPLHQLTIIPFKDKDHWILIPKYTIGVKF